MSMIEIKGLCKSFGDHEVLKGIDQNVEEGEVLCIVGPSGSGKSTMLRCINRQKSRQVARSISMENVLPKRT